MFVGRGAGSTRTLKLKPLKSSLSTKLKHDVQVAIALLIGLQHQYDCPAAPPLSGPNCECGFDDLPARLLDLRTDLPTSKKHRNWIHALSLPITVSLFREYGVCPKPCGARALDDCKCGTKRQLSLIFDELESLLDELALTPPDLWDAV